MVNPQLDLNFATGSYQFNSTSYALQDLLQFSRASAGTFTGSNSLIQNSPVSKNLLLWTEEFDNAAWTKLALNITANSIAAPNGITSADTFTGTATSYCYVTQITPTLTTGVNYTLSRYVKAGTANFCTLALHAQADVYFDLANLTYNAVGTGFVSAAIVDVGNGWRRISATWTKDSGTTYQIYFALASSLSSQFGITVGANMYSWGAQLEVGSSATVYSRNSGGFFPPRFDYDPITLEAKGLLIEEQRTNLVPYSEQFDDASWTKFQASITANASTSPDGTTNADKLVENSVSAVHEVKKNFTTVASTTYTMSVYLKADGRNWVFVNFFNVGVADFRTFFNLSNGTVGTNPAGSTATITSVGNGWYRCTVTRTTDVGQTSTGINIGLADADNSPSYLGNGTSGALVWGAQAELGAFASAYIPTVASTVTRAADVSTVILPTLSGLYNPAAGTLVVDVIPQLANTVNQFIGSLSDGTATNRASIFKTSAGFSGFRTTSAGVATNPTAPANAMTGNVTHKVALALTTGANNVACAVDGTLGTPATLSAMPTGINIIRLGVSEDATTGWLNGHIRRIRYFNTRLTNAELQAVTDTSSPSSSSGLSKGVGLYAGSSGLYGGSSGLYSGRSGLVN